MKILVTVEEVAEVEDEFEISGLDIDERNLEYDLNEWDDYAVEEEDPDFVLTGVQAAADSFGATSVALASLSPDRLPIGKRYVFTPKAQRQVRREFGKPSRCF